MEMSSGAEASVAAIAPYLQMETKLSSAPLSLAVMANLNLIAAQADDFSLLLGAAGKDLETNEIIRNPTSFRGTVVQVHTVLNFLISFFKNE